MGQQSAGAPSHHAPATPSIVPSSRQEALSLVTVFRERVLAEASSVAVIDADDGVSLTYAEVDHLSDRLANAVIETGVEPGTSLIGIALQRSWRVGVAILAVLKAGCGYVPLDSSHPATRRRFMVNDAAVAVILGDDRSRFETSIAWLDFEIGSAANSPVAPWPEVLSASPAYVIYTSGSTGQPKGVEVTHGNVMSLLEAARERFDFRPGAWTQFHSHAFDFAVWEMWGPIFFGGTAVVVSERQATDPAEFVALLADSPTTVLNQVPSVFKHLVRACEDLGGPPLELEHVIFGGESLDADSVRRWWAMYGQRATLINMYGITETTVHVTAQVLTPDALDSACGGTPIGRPLPNASVRLVDPQLQPVREGETGEILVGGAGVARGYLNRPELTEQRFVTMESGGANKWYRSGDLASINGPDGDLVFRGRADSQVKLRGFRIELDEIALVLGTHPAVDEVYIVLAQRPEISVGPDIVAFYTTGGVPKPTSVSDETLRAFLIERLPSYMVPARLTHLESVPQTVGGKVDMAALRALGAEANDASTAARHADDGIIGTVAALWCQVLAVSAVDETDDFFALGGHSLLAMRLVALIRREMDIRVSVRTLYENSTLRDFCVRIGQT